MERISQESEENNEQDFLPEILREICKNLNAYDLGRAAAVNKLWNEVATREQKKRGLERSVIPVGKDDFHDSVRTKPYVALMFVAPKVIQYGVKSIELDVLKKYKNSFPNYLVAVGLHFVAMDNAFIDCDHDLTEGGILGLFIPEYRDLKIRATYTQHLDDDLKFLNEFLPEDAQSKATFIVFAQQAYNNEHFFQLLQNNMDERHQKFNLWGAAFDNAPFAAVNHQIDKSIENEFAEPMHNCGTQYNGMFAMSITGSSLESWSIVIDCITKKHEFGKKLMDFRDQLKLKRHTIGLACGPDEVSDFSGEDLSDVYMTFPEMLHAVKVIFTDVRFTGIYDRSCLNSYYGLKSKKDDPSQKLEHQMAFSVIILTFD